MISVNFTKKVNVVFSLYSLVGDAEDIVQSNRINKMYAESKFSFCYNKSIFNEQ